MNQAAPQGLPHNGEAILLVEYLSVTHEREGALAIVHLRGRIDSATASEFETQLGTLFADPLDALIIEMTELDYISSAGLRVLLVVAKRAKAEGRPLVLCNLAPGIQEVFDVSGFTAIFNIATTRAEAVAHARN